MVIALTCKGENKGLRSTKINHVNKISFISNDAESLYVEFATSREALPMATETLDNLKLNYNKVVGGQGLIINGIKGFTVTTR